ncbi:MAG TPA: polyprenyl synthetase family protein, partial [Moraxellaceae bacterium]|nr:polyprenyl synthetase family protein [Moraxellaceae bacterium]
AFIALGEGRVSAEGTADQLRALAMAAADMAVGQALDLAGEGQSLDVAALEQIHRHKTGALIRASVALGAIAGGGGEAVRKALDTFADRLGLAFQVHDDVLDVIGDTNRIGKTAGADAALRKSTYPALLGLAEAQALAVHLHDEAVAALASLGPAANPLRELAHFLVSRDH